MAKKKVNIFSISILDILSGALGAVIILYIILPKFNSDTLDKVKELESLNSTLVQVEELEDMVSKLENSVDKELFEKIEAQIEKLKNTIETLRDEVKTLQRDLQSAKKEIEDLKQEISELESKVKDLNDDIVKLRMENEELKAYKIWMQNCGFDLNDECPSRVDIGFKFQGKNVLYIIDVSGSMSPGNHNNWEDRLNYVKSGIKMLITTMDDSYKFDIIKFPYCTNKSCTEGYVSKPNWGELRYATKSNKDNQYSFIKRLKAGGGTPTRDVLKYALKNYPELTDIVLLSDGEPTSNITGNKDDTDDILREISSLNINNVRINAIGVGADFFDDPYHAKVQFMKKLTYQNGRGFFVDFY